MEHRQKEEKPCKLFLGINLQKNGLFQGMLLQKNTAFKLSKTSVKVLGSKKAFICIPMHEQIISQSSCILNRVWLQSYVCWYILISEKMNH